MNLWDYPVLVNNTRKKASKIDKVNVLRETCHIWQTKWKGAGHSPSRSHWICVLYYCLGFETSERPIRVTRVSFCHYLVFLDPFGRSELMHERGQLVDMRQTMSSIRSIIIISTKDERYKSVGIHHRLNEQ